MTQMEVDLHSPSFRTTRSSATALSKRPRSPDALNPLDRPAKRPSLAVDTLPSYLRHGLHGSSTNSSRHPSEDWVQQAGGLTIDSPSFPISGASTSNDVGEEAQNASDENMNMDPDENETGSSRRRLQTSYTLFPLAQGSHQQCNPHPPHQNQQQSRQNAQTTSTQRSSHSYSTLPVEGALQLQPLCSPDINAASHTPIPRYDAQSNPSIQSSSSIVDGPMSVSISTTPSYANICISSPRKQRFTMGPRADCEKCRLGVKGHWMHLD